MDADQHRQEAERLLAQHSTDPEYVRLTVERAKVHALLAIEARLAGDVPDDLMVTGPPEASACGYPCVRDLDHTGSHRDADGLEWSR